MLEGPHVDSLGAQGDLSILPFNRCYFLSENYSFLKKELLQLLPFLTTIIDEFFVSFYDFH